MVKIRSTVVVRGLEGESGVSVSCEDFANRVDVCGRSEKIKILQ